MAPQASWFYGGVGDEYFFWIGAFLITALEEMCVANNAVA